jgi:outer membrane receptor protein involved in Fe transport
VPYWRLDHKGSYFLDRANQAHKRYPGRTLQDAGVTFRFPRWKMKFTAEVRNLTDKHTFDTQGMPLPGRSGSGTMTWGM